MKIAYVIGRFQLQLQATDLDDGVQIEMFEPDIRNQARRAGMWIARTNDEIVRGRLMEMGWLPPEKATALLNHCKDAECEECARIVCPKQDPFHFHHDGCPSCSTEG